MNLQLPNGEKIIDADQKLVAAMRYEYELYDGIDVRQDSALTLFDILLSVMMNSRLDTAAKVHTIWDGKRPVEEALSTVPADISLQDENVPWEQLEQLFDAFCGIKYAGPAVTTKILHKKRPKLIPILDRVVQTCIGDFNSEPPLPRGSSQGQHLVRSVKGFRHVMLGCIEDIEKLRRVPGMKPFPWAMRYWATWSGRKMAGSGSHSTGLIYGTCGP